MTKIITTISPVILKLLSISVAYMLQIAVTELRLAVNMATKLVVKMHH